MTTRETLRAALAECAAAAGNWCRLMDAARNDPDRVELTCPQEWYHKLS